MGFLEGLSQGLDPLFDLYTGGSKERFMYERNLQRKREEEDYQRQQEAKKTQALMGAMYPDKINSTATISGSPSVNNPIATPVANRPMSMSVGGDNLVGSALSSLNVGDLNSKYDVGSGFFGNAPVQDKVVPSSQINAPNYDNVKLGVQQTRESGVPPELQALYGVAGFNDIMNIKKMQEAQKLEEKNKMQQQGLLQSLVNQGFDPMQAEYLSKDQKALLEVFSGKLLSSKQQEQQKQAEMAQKRQTANTYLAALKGRASPEILKAFQGLVEMEDVDLKVLTDAYKGILDGSVKEEQMQNYRNNRRNNDARTAIQQQQASNQQFNANRNYNWRQFQFFQENDYNNDYNTVPPPRSPAPTKEKVSSATVLKRLDNILSK